MQVIHQSPRSQKKKLRLGLSFFIEKNFMKSPNLNALDLYQFKATGDKFKFVDFDETEAECNGDSSFIAESLAEALPKPNLKRCHSEGTEIAEPSLRLRLRPTETETASETAAPVKSNIIDTYEKREEFYDDDISPLLGCIVLFFSALICLAGIYGFISEFVYELPQIQAINMPFTSQAILPVMVFVFFWSNYTSLKFVKHT